MHVLSVRTHAQHQTRVEKIEFCSINYSYSGGFRRFYTFFTLNRALGVSRFGLALRTLYIRNKMRSRSSLAYLNGLGWTKREG